MNIGVRGHRKHWNTAGNTITSHVTENTEHRRKGNKHQMEQNIANIICVALLLRPVMRLALRNGRAVKEYKYNYMPYNIMKFH
jgi:hypothetical protein